MVVCSTPVMPYILPIMSAQVITSAPIRCPPPTSPQLLTPPNSPTRSTPPSVCTPTTPCSPCNGVNLVPCTVPLTSILPLKVPLSPAIYTLSSRVVQCTPRLINGHSVLPGICPITPTSPITQVIPPDTVVPNTPIFSVSPYSSPSLCSPSSLHSTSPWKQSYGMEQVWQFEFKSLFAQYSPHNWTLFPVDEKPEGFWNSNVDSAKVRFCCEECGHGWTSMKGRVAFWFVLSPLGEGHVRLKLYGQQCDRCKNGTYESAMWYPEEVLKVLVNIYNKVGQVYYGFQQAPYHRARRAGKPRTPHNSDLCQACKDGVCSERR